MNTMVQTPLIDRISLRTQLYFAKEMAIRAVGVVGCMMAFAWLFHQNYLFILEMALMGLAVIELIPSAILHLEYYDCDKSKSLSVDKAAQTMTIIDEDLSHVLRFNDIDSIRVVMGQELFDGSKRGWYSFEIYHYAVIHTKANEKFIVTCLMMTDLRNAFRDLGLPVVWERKRFPLLSREREKSSDGW